LAKAALNAYRTKRDFSKTAEPSGEHQVASSRRLRFVVQKHAARQLHYDLRLEWNGVFKSWAVARGPSLDPADKRLAVEVEDHPLDYGDFEGTIPKGEYGGGTVQLWDRGLWSPEGSKTTEDAFKAGDLKFTLEGSKLKGSWVLVRMRSDRFGGKRTNWLLIKHRDEYSNAGDADALLKEDRSVASDRSMQQITDGVGSPPKPFMLATAKAAKANAVWMGKGVDATAITPAPETPGRRTPARPTPQPATAGRAKAARAKPVMVKELPKFIEPQLSKLAERPPDRPGWAHEVKFDGYRAQLRVEGGKVHIRTRKGLDWTTRFSAIAVAAAAFPDCVIDGEIVALDQKQLPSFGLLQAALSAEKTDNLVLFAFDLLIEGREDLRTLPLSERKLRLEKLIGTRDANNRIRYVAHLESNAEAVLASACKIGLEGIISKRLDAPYRSGRTDSWLKAKCRAGQEVVLGGWTTEAGTLRSLLAGVYRNGRLVYVGRIGTGYGRAVSKPLLPRLEKLTRDKSPFTGADAPPKEANVRWLKPELVAEIEFAGWTGAGMIREAAFKGLREDKDPVDVVAEVPASEPAAGPAEGSAPKTAVPELKRARASSKSRKAPPGSASAASTVLGVTISKPDKALWPDAGDGKPVTKLELARYYEHVGEWMLPHLAGRPCSLLRAPNGIGEEEFFQRHAMPGMSELFDFVKVHGDKAAYVQIDRLEALAAVAQIGALELHPWNCAPNDPEVAGRLVFDLDPAPDVKFDAVIAAAHEIRERLEKVGLISFCKTTGGKGLHVVTPLTVGKKAVKWPIAKNFAHLVCAQMAQESPARYLDTMSKAKRAGRIFLDYLRNDRTATAAAVLSPRARDGATVSMPMLWRDVKKGLASRSFTVRTAPELLGKTKPWKDYAAGARPLTDAIKQITR
jgi:bifunctional non-homologous end joining protein LigD